MELAFHLKQIGVPNTPLKINVLRKNFFREIMQHRLDQVILRAFTERWADPPFSSDQIQPFRKFLDEFLLAQGIQPDWSVPKDQQLCLFILQKLCMCMQDPDTALFPYLIEGVPLGIDEEIQPSHCFPIHSSDIPFDPPLLSVHHTNWVVPFDGTMEDAQVFFQDGLAVGKLGLAVSDSRPPRLVLDPPFVE